MLFVANKRSRESLADLTAAHALGGADSILATMALLTEHGGGDLMRTYPPIRARIEAVLDYCGRQASELTVRSPGEPGTTGPAAHGAPVVRSGPLRYRLMRRRSAAR